MPVAGHITKEAASATWGKPEARAPADQLATLAAESITHLELRSAWSTNVADLSDGQLASFRRVLNGAGVQVSAIGSPIGKIALDAPFGPDLDRMPRRRHRLRAPPRSCASSPFTCPQGRRPDSAASKSSTA